MKRTLPTEEELLRRMHDGELENIKDFVPHNSATDVLETDEGFWKSLGGFDGLLREHQNAVCFVQLCQLYVRDSKMDKRGVDYVASRSFAISFLRKTSLPEQAIRVFWRRMPHFCARWSAYLYWEAATYTQMLNLEYGNGLLTA